MNWLVEKRKETTAVNPPGPKIIKYSAQNNYASLSDFNIKYAKATWFDSRQSEGSKSITLDYAKSLNCF